MWSEGGTRQLFKDYKNVRNIKKGHQHEYRKVSEDNDHKFIRIRERLARCERNGGDITEYATKKQIEKHKLTILKL